MKSLLCGSLGRENTLYSFCVEVLAIGLDPYSSTCPAMWLYFHHRVMGRGTVCLAKCSVLLPSSLPGLIGRLPFSPGPLHLLTGFLHGWPVWGSQDSSVHRSRKGHPLPQLPRKRGGQIWSSAVLQRRARNILSGFCARGSFTYDYRGGVTNQSDVFDPPPPYSDWLSLWTNNFFVLPSEHIDKTPTSGLGRVYLLRHWFGVCPRSESLLPIRTVWCVLWKLLFQGIYASICLPVWDTNTLRYGKSANIFILYCRPYNSWA